MFSVDGSCDAAAPFPPAGPGAPGSPSSSVLRGRYDVPPRISSGLWLRLGSPHGPGCSCSPQRSRRTPSSPSGQEPCSAGAPGPAVHVRARAGPLRFPGDPSPRLCRAPRPRSNRSSSPMADFPVLPPGPTHRRLRQDHDFEADTRLQRPLSTLHERRRRHPCKTRFRLAGCAFAGRVSNPLGHDERFPATSFPLSRAHPDAS